MYRRKLAWRVKRMLAGVLAAGLVLTGMPVSVVQAANEVLEEQPDGEAGESASREETGQEGTGGMESPGTDGETGASEGKEDDQETETPEEEGNGSDAVRPGDGEMSSDADSPEEGDGSSDTEKPGGAEDSSDEKVPGEGDQTGQLPEEPGASDGTASDTSKPGAEDADPDGEEAVTGGDVSVEASHYNAQVSGNDISGNDLMLYSEKEEEGYSFVGGYIELPEERNIPVVDESLPMDYNGDGIALAAEESLPARYVPTPGTLPATRDQAPYGSCWAHSAMALAEIDMIKNGNASLDVNYSEHHLAYFSYNYNSETVKDPLGGLDGDSNACVYTEEYPNYMERGGNLMNAQKILSSWVGAADEDTLPYPENDESLIGGNIGEDIAFNDVVHLQNGYEINPKENPGIVKQKIMEYGAVGISYYDGDSYYDKKNNSYYCGDQDTTNHAVTVVGWDDGFSAFDGLSNKPNGPGAWLIRNSWLKGKDIDILDKDETGLETMAKKRTYFWLSYEDTSLSAAYAFDFEPADNYQHNYQYDGCVGEAKLTLPGSKVRAANVYTAKGCEKGEQLKAVGIRFMQAQTPYKVYVYKNPNADAPDTGELVAEKSGANQCAGFYTVSLDTPVNLKKGDTFAVVVELEKPLGAEKIELACEASINSDWFWCEAKAGQGQSFYKSMYSEGQWYAWNDFGKENQVNLRIKAYTVDREEGPDTPETYKVTFDVQGHGEAPEDMDVEAGERITEPVAPVAEGYVFDGWYRDEAYTRKWDFVTDTVTENLTLYAKWLVSLEDASVSVGPGGSGQVTYNGFGQEPEVSVLVSGTTLVKGTDYTVSYKDNRNAGTAAVTVKGIGSYSGTVTENFTIHKAPLKMKADDITIWAGDPLPEKNKYSYRLVEGELFGSDKMIQEPSFSCTAANSETAGTYDIILSDAKVGRDGQAEDNYTITYEKGSLFIQEKPAVTYTVTFDMRGHGQDTAPDPADYTGIAAGGKIKRPADPTEEGYHFSGWYKEETCTNIWDFDKDTVTKDLTLYAGWKEIISLADAKVSVVLDGVDGFTYNGEEQKPKVTVGLSDGTILTENADYILSYGNNRNAGTATVTVTGKGAYSGTAGTTFEIRKVELIVKPKDTTIRVGDPLPAGNEYDYELAEGSGSLISGDQLKYPTSSTCDVEDSDVAGEYPVVPSEDADAGDNYSISYRNGILKIVEEFVYFTVTFDVQGHGTAPAKLENVPEGSTIAKPGEDPSEEGYRFGGWYQDAACTKAWNFDTDKVQGDLTLFAKWEKESVSLLDGNVSLEDTTFTYDGTEQKPKVVVSVSDSMLEEGTDYSLSYENNRNAGTATVTVTGTGGYSGTVSKTFVIRPAPLTIWAKDKTILVNAPVPEEKEYEYGMGDLMPGDRLLTEPSFSCGIMSTAEEGEYEIKIFGADAGGNYVLSYLNGTLRVVSEYDFCTVTFDVQGHGTAPAALEHVREGSTIAKPEEDPVEEGYRFAGWYKDEACTIAWNFDTDKVQGDLTLYAKWEKESIMIRDEDVSLGEEVFVYDGMMHRPKVTVTVSGVVLVEGQDYSLTYENNRDAGTATVHVLGINGYSGTAAGYFRIESRVLMIRAKDKTILRGGPIPAGSAYEYEVSGLAAGDALVREPSFSCAITSSDTVGKYDIVPYGADAGKNYTITYAAGILTVADEYVSFTVTFDLLGHGGASMSYVGIKAGDTIDRPSDPAEAGYRFAGWCKDRACTEVWDFENDVVQADLVLYAKWLQLAASGDEKGFAVQEVADLYYTGKQCKPAVSVYDGGMLLKAGKDYQIKYHNNINANKGGIKKTGNGAGTFFNPALPYVEIIGKGNYAKKAEVNFNILRKPIGDGGADPASGVKLKVNDQLVTAAGKTLKPFVSIRYGKAMRLDTDYTLKLTAVKAKDAAGGSITGEMDGSVVSAGCSGEFLLTIAGQGNYDGSICRTVYVADKAHLMKNTSVTLGKNQKNVTFAGGAVELNAAESDSADAFTVKYRKTVLRPGRDYTVSYRNNDRVGKAELLLTGIGEYTGTKTVTFRIRGAKFSTNTVNVGGVEDKVYTGRAWTQNDAVLTYSGGSGQTLSYGVDYTISYRNNINKGTATMLFKGREEAGYSGSFRKTFRIAAADISQASQSESMKGLVFAYCKAGVKPVDEIVLRNQNGSLLQNGRDYTLQYANNKAVADASDAQPPVVIVKGRGNYTGELRVPFGIAKADLRGATVKTSSVAYKDNQPPEYAYKPAVRLMDGQTTLREGKDYLIAYQNNTQADLKKYMKQANAGGGAPVAVITVSESSPYRLDYPIVVPLPVYQEKFKKTEMQVEFGNTLYTGSQVRPPVKVYYGGRLLVENADYTLLYGKNVKSGRKQGSITISGVAPKYGGSVTVKFDIVRKDITY